MNANQHDLHILPTVKEALLAGKPVVGFETTILSHGLPWPDNLATANACELIAENSGATPATMALLDGKIRAGLTADELQHFCAPGTAANAVKVNLQNFEIVLRSGRDGALTVAGSLMVAACAGLKVFCTGGIGGVHRDYTRTHDESSDLIALARYPVATVCAGIKSILDVPATLERLETLGVPVLGFRTESLPCFFSRSSPYPVTYSTDSIIELANIVESVLENGRGVLLVTPVPTESSIDFQVVEAWIAKALDYAQEEGVQGKAVTPFLLQQMAKLSDGKTLRANLALIQNNARVASELASALAKK